MRANEEVTCGKEGDFPLEWLDQIRWKEGEKVRKEREKEREEKREKRRGVRSSYFSLNFTEIGPSVLVRARGKVGPCNESYTCNTQEFV